MASKDAERREFGYIRKLKSGRYSATYADPYKTKVETRSGKERVVDHRAPFTFESRADAEEWLVDERRLMTSGTWRPPAGTTWTSPGDATSTSSPTVGSAGRGTSRARSPAGRTP